MDVEWKNIEYFSVGKFDFTNMIAHGKSNLQVKRQDHWRRKERVIMQKMWEIKRRFSQICYLDVQSEKEGTTHENQFISTNNKYLTEKDFLLKISVLISKIIYNWLWEKLEMENFFFQNTYNSISSAFPCQQHYMMENKLTQLSSQYLESDQI